MSAPPPRPLDVHAVSRPARTFTGDFYFTQDHGDRFWFAHGDVAGKGLPAAVVMAMIQEEIEHRITSCAETACDPATTTRRLHEFLAPLLPSNRFATGVIGHLDHDGTLTVANAGHCPPLVLRADGSIEAIHSTGPLLGLLPSPSWTSFSTRLLPGDFLVLYSDGVMEASVAGHELGLDGLQSRLRPGLTSEALASTILAGLETTDDVTLMVVGV